MLDWMNKVNKQFQKINRNVFKPFSDATAIKKAVVDGDTRSLKRKLKNKVKNKIERKIGL